MKPSAKNIRRSSTLMIPIVKGWLTERSIDVRVDRPAGVRRDGLHRRDRHPRSSIATCGSPASTKATTGIQALDLVGRN